MLFTEITLLISYYLSQLSEFLITKKTILSKKLSTKKHQQQWAYTSKRDSIKLKFFKPTKAPYLSQLNFKKYSFF